MLNASSRRHLMDLFSFLFFFMYWSPAVVCEWKQDSRCHLQRRRRFRQVLPARSAGYRLRPESVAWLLQLIQNQHGTAGQTQDGMGVSFFGNAIHIHTLNTAVHTQRFPTLTKLPSAIFQSNSWDFSVHLFVMLSAAEWMTGCVESPSCRCLRHSCDNSDARRLESEILFGFQGQCAVSSPFSLRRLRLSRLLFFPLYLTTSIPFYSPLGGQ